MGAATRTVTDFRVVRALRAHTPHDASAQRLAQHVPTQDAAAVITDARGWLAHAEITIPVSCRAHQEGSRPGRAQPHTITLRPDGTIAANDHPHATEWDAERVLTALGADTPTCVLYATAAATGTPLPSTHSRLIHGVHRTPALTLRHLTAARAWLAHDPATDLSALELVPANGLGPQHWAAWQDAGFTVQTATPFLAADLPLALATPWLDAGLTTTRAALLARRGRTPADVLPLIPHLGTNAAYDWAEHAATMPIDTQIDLARRGYTAKAAASAVRTVGVPGAHTFADHGLAGASIDTRTGAWWLVLPDHPDDAAAWSALGFTPAQAIHLIDTRAEAFDDDSDDFAPHTVADWVAAGVTSLDELRNLAALTYHPSEWPGPSRPVGPDGVAIAWDHAIWLARHVDNPEDWIAASAGAPEWVRDWDGPRCFTPDCDQPACRDDAHAHQHRGNVEISPFYGLGHPFFNKDRNALLDAICEAVTEGVPDTALPVLARHSRVGVAAWTHAIGAASERLDDEDLTTYLDWACRATAAAPDADASVDAWREQSEQADVPMSAAA